MWALFVLVVALTSVAGQMTASWRTGVVTEHNNERSTIAVPAATNMITLVYNTTIESVAQNYLDTTYPNGCGSGYTHNPNRGNLGENYYSGKPTANGTEVGSAAAWTTAKISTCAERDNFYSQNGCTQMPAYNADGSFNSSWNTGHFTQVMWAVTAQIGCGWKSGCGTVCNYYPPGNMNLPKGLLKPTDIWQVASTAAPATTKAATGAPTTTKATTAAPATTKATTAAPTTTKATTAAPGATTTKAPSTAAPATTAAPGAIRCYNSNDANLGTITPSSTYTSNSGCSSTRSTACTVCGPLSVTQSGSTQITINVNVTCPSGTTVNWASPIFVSTNNQWGGGGSADAYGGGTLTNGVHFTGIYGVSGAANALLRGEWCVGGNYAAFPVTVIHTN